MSYKWIIRSARSLSPIDLLASNSSEVIAVQVKVRGYLSEDERRNLIEWSEKFKAKPILPPQEKGKMVFRASNRITNLTEKAKGLSR